MEILCTFLRWLRCTASRIRSFPSRSALTCGSKPVPLKIQCILWRVNQRRSVITSTPPVVIRCSRRSKPKHFDRINGTLNACRYIPYLYQLERFQVTFLHSKTQPHEPSITHQLRNERLQRFQLATLALVKCTVFGARNVISSTNTR
jgi:hypothetical protein